MPKYNLTEYSDNYSDTSASLWQFKRDALNVNDINTALTNDNAPSFNYKPVLLVIQLLMKQTAKKMMEN